MPMVSVQMAHLSHHFPTRLGVLPVLDDVGLTIAPGSFVSIVGTSGCGKSTLLKLVAGLETQTGGRIQLSGQSPARQRQQKQIGWMSQQAALLPWRTVLENVELPLLINRQTAANSLPAPMELLQIVGLAEFADAYPHTLSGGMQQRAALVRTLAISAALWLMDEPFAALDELTRESLADLLLSLWQQFQTTVLWVTHSLAEAVRLSDRVVLLSPRPGRVIGDIVVPLPRPRDDTGPAFQAIMRQVRQTLREGANA